MTSRSRSVKRQIDARIREATVLNRRTYTELYCADIGPLRSDATDAGEAAPTAPLRTQDVGVNDRHAIRQDEFELPQRLERIDIQIVNIQYHDFRGETFNRSRIQFHRHALRDSHEIERGV